jgi:hypothetical protein
MRWAERHIEAQLTASGLQRTHHGKNYGKWREIKDGETRYLSVFFKRADDGGPFPHAWTKRDTDAIFKVFEEANEKNSCPDKHPTHAHLFVVVGAEVEDCGRGRMYVSSPYLRLPQTTLRAPDSRYFINHLPREQHTLRHAPDVPGEMLVVSMNRGAELRSVFADSP